MDERSCLACGADLSETRRRKYCNDACRMRYQRGARASADAAAEEQPAPGAIGTTEAATMFVLAEAQRLGTPLGQAALVLARRLDASHADTGAGLASLAKQLQSTLEAATANAEMADDPVDELERRRQEKLRAAAGG